MGGKRNVLNGHYSFLVRISIRKSYLPTVRVQRVLFFEIAVVCTDAINEQSSNNPCILHAAQTHAVLYVCQKFLLVLGRNVKYH